MTESVVALPDRRATRLLGRAIARAVRPGDLYVFEGPLGSGKTFLIRAICRALGLEARFRVTSPTFTLVHEYPTTPPVLHADLYRLKTPEEVVALGLLEQRDGGRVLLVEWGGKYTDLLGGDAVLVELAVSPRRAMLRATGPEAAHRVREIE